MKTKRILSMVLVVLMMISLMPMTAFAGEIETVMNLANFTVIDNDQSTLAPGVNMNELVLYNSSNQRVEMYVTTVDTAVDTVKVKANYINNQNAVFGMQTLSDQVAAMEANYAEPFKIVAGINASYYNTTTGQPTGAFVMEGIDASASGDNYAFFAVLKDGTYIIGAKGEYSTYKDQLQEAIGGWQHIVKDGVVTSGLDKTTLYPRQTLGLTADGKLILMTADGSQAPATVGLTIHEQAEVMLALGCVEAIHLDGGNSATFGAIREGTDEFVTVNSPSGGSERAVSNTLMIISTAVPDGTFDHAVIESEYDYLLPYSKYTFSAFGVDATNAAAEIPATATWALSDSKFGTITDGVFVSNGTIGNVDIQLKDNGNVVGSRTVTIVNPTSFTFGATETTVPYGKTSELKITAMYGNFEAFCVPEVFEWTVNPVSAGTMNGFSFTAADNEKITEATVTAIYKYDSLIESQTITTKFGKGSEVLFDFEDGDISDWHGTETIGEWIDAKNAENPNAKYPIYKPESNGNSIENTRTDVFLASKDNGDAVKSGDYALGVSIDRLNAEGVGSWVYNYLLYTGETQIWRDVSSGKSAVRVGMWVNMPQNAVNTALRICRTFTKDSSGKLYTNYDYMLSDYDGAKVSYNTNYGIPESGWIYVYYDLTAYDFQSSLQYNPNENYAVNNGKSPDGNYYPAFIQFINGTTPADDTMEELIIYIDDITLDYSDVTEDRDAPVISELSVCSDTANFVALNGQTVTNNLLSFTAKASDVSGNSNATGLNYATAKIYIDGMDVSDKSSFNAGAGTISLNDVYLTNGEHTVTFVIYDNQGNESRATKTLTVNGSAANALVTIAGHNDGNHTPKAGSVYYLDVTASDADQISKIVTTIKLNTANKFEYDNIICAKGVTVEVYKDKINNELTLSITNDGTQSGNAVLASIPVRVWSWDESYGGATASAQFASGRIPVINIECETLYGEITYDGSEFDNYITGFHDAIDIVTELDNKTAWHTHTSAPVADLDPTCTENGYTGRTYCSGCASVVDWGTPVVTTGHSYKEVNGKLVCDCGDEYKENGLVESGNDLYYMLGGSLISGWNYIDTEDESTTGYYYFSTTDYKAVDGEQKINGYSYKFVDHVLLRGALIKNGDFIKYMWAGEWLKNSWATIDGEKYYFTSDGAAKIGPSTIRGQNGTFAFNVDGIWLEGRTGLMEIYGRTYYYENGFCKAAGLVKVDDDYYYINPNYQITTGKCWVGKPNTAVTGYTEGEYEFDEDGKLIGKIAMNGPINGKFYIDGVMQKAYQVVEYNGDYYFISDGHMLARNCKLYLSEHFVDGTGLSVGYHEFDADGKVVIKNGVVGDYFYINNVRQNAYQVVEYEGYYYFISDGHNVAKNCKLYLGEQFVSGTALNVGYHEFDAEGKIVLKNGVVGDYFYLNNIRQNAYQVIEFEGDYYFINDGHKVAKNCKLYLSEQFVSGTALNVGYHEFDSDGKIIFKNGVIGDYFYLNNIRQNAYQVVEYEGDYYFISDGHKVAKNCTLYLNEQFVAGTDLSAGVHTFGADGKLELKNGVFGDYFYINNVKQTAYQVVEFEGDYYFISDGHKVAKNRKLYILESYLYKYGLPAGQYSFDADGKMILKNGPVDGRFYIDGVQQNAYQLVKYDGNYYFVGDGNSIVKNSSVYLTKEYVYGTGLREGKYEFDSTGKMILY